MRIPFYTLVLWVAFTLPVHAADFELEQTQEGIHLKVRNQPLSKVLQAIGEKSGIAFFMQKALYETPVTSDIQASSWRLLVGELLKDFSKIEIWSEDTAGSKIRITGLGDYVPPAPGAVADQREPTVIPVPKTEANLPRSVSIPKRNQPTRPKRLKRAEELYPNHPLAKLPAHVFMEPAILNYLLKNNVDIPDAFKRKYGLPINKEEEAMGLHTKRRSLPIPNEIYNDPKFDEYLKAVGLPKPPQIPPGFKKLKPGERP